MSGFKYPCVRRRPTISWALDIYARAFLAAGGPPDMLDSELVARRADLVAGGWTDQAGDEVAGDLRPRYRTGPPAEADLEAIARERARHRAAGCRLFDDGFAKCTCPTPPSPTA